ncbi:myosin-related family protein [Striga asiatica]|uniref:Myosin-related family protein n=1 Tax=Striga asiatica TaxID=4170 RepID=A0A5A7Q0D6_STRAF|nr:myosin-related family protein [Striga asiatica]
MFCSPKDPVMATENKCTGRCKSVVRRIVEQVRAETDQWAQMQEMLAQLRGEMEELQASRDFWENRAYNLEHEIQSLRKTVEEWKLKATKYENKASQLQLEVSILKEQIQNPSAVPLGKQLEKEKKLKSFRMKKNSQVEEKEQRKYESLPELEEEEVKTAEERTPKRGGLSVPLSLGKQLAKEKRKILRHLRENYNRAYDDNGGDRERRSKRDSGRRKKSCSTGFGVVEPIRSPLMDISSLSPITQQISRSSFFGLRNPETSRVRGSFRM